jgi:hypothetical protein
MVLSRSILALSVIVSLTNAQGLILLERAPLEAFGIEKNKEGFNAEPTLDDELFGQWAPPSQLGTKNASTPRLKDRSLELLGRQSCESGYGYCASKCYVIYPQMCLTIT